MALTMYIANKADCRLLNVCSSLAHRRSFCFDELKKMFIGVKTKASAHCKLDRFSLRSALLAIYVNVTGHFKSFQTNFKIEN